MFTRSFKYSFPTMGAVPTLGCSHNLFRESRLLRFAEDESDAAKGGGSDKGEGKGEDSDDGERKGSAQERIQALNKAKNDEKLRADAAEAELQKIRNERAEEEKKKLAEQGEFKTLYEAEKAQREADQDQLKKLQDEIKSRNETVASQVQEQLDSIKDADKRKIVEELLEGKTPEKQLALLPKVFDMAGVKSKKLGSGLPGDGTEGKTTEDQEESEYKTLFAKQEAHLKQGKEALTPSEKRKLLELGSKISKRRAEKEVKKSNDTSDQVFY